MMNSIADVKLSSFQNLPETPKSGTEALVKSPNKIAPSPVASNVHRLTSFENLARAERPKSDPREDENQQHPTEKNPLILQPVGEPSKTVIQSS